MDALEILRSEFGSEPGSFMLTARIERRWDRAAFQQLQRAMLEVCREVAGRESIERWIAEGFWFVEGFVRDDCNHPDFHRPEPAYYDAARERTFALSFWLFTGESLYTPGYGWPDV
ncbi:hypothetical protein [Actinospica robiniae]|uniref:hypothetical protein n=1 Tax=Actinospica robiniae TaxID=304901 RepID=UPI0005502E10|nr:hypothetical protein [Actinospica robiniae]